MDPAKQTTPVIADHRRDEVAAAALAVIRRALIEGVPITRERLAQEASVALDAPPQEALMQVDAEAQRLGVSSLR